MPHAMHAQTPSLQAIDGRGLIVRHVNYHRAQIGETAQARIERRQYDPAARPTATWDPRFSARLEENPATRPNLANVFSLSGTPLAVESVDAGWQVSLFGEAGQLLDNWDARGSHWLNEYDEFLRPSATHEQSEGRTYRTSERFLYADSSEQAVADNLCGRLIRSDDGAGSEQLLAYGITGQVLQQTRRFLSSLELPDWPADLALREALLEPGAGATTCVTYGPTGEMLSHTDALGNRQLFTYTVSGQMGAVSLTPSGGIEQILLQDLRHNAFGQAESQTAGNGMLSRARFDPADGRLQELTTTRANTEPLQHLLYQYDPVGNVISIEDRAQPTRHFSNQRIEPVNHYEHDSLYQLIKATGRETAGATIRPELPELATLPLDTSQWLNYTQHYHYDEAGNLLELKHEGAQPYTRKMRIADDSNRALPWRDGDAPPDFAMQFDANGNLQTLTAGQSLHWSARNQLLEVNALTRTNGDNDRERYAYDASGMRLRKTATAQAKTVVHTREVRYLPGLEIRTDSATGEHLEVMTLQAGRANVRCLHWIEQGKPDGIQNDQVRYSVDDHLGSSTLELDGEARLISYEGYYPFGGTAWWAAYSVIEASYKTIRYSGMERDSSGLYYYGLRYYAPWLLRWISADPLGNADGLNLYQMARNNPINRVDQQGGQSVDFGYLPILGTGVVIGGAMTALAMWGYSQYSARAERDRKITAYRQYFERVETEHGLSGREIEELDVFMTSINAMPNQMTLRQDAITNALTAFYLPSANQKNFYTKHQQSALFMTMPTVKDFIHKELRAAVYPEVNWDSGNRSRTVSEMSGLTSVSQAGSSASTITAAEKQAYRKGPRSSKRSASSVVTQPVVDATLTQASQHILTVDAEGFFEDPNIAKYLGKNKARGMENAVRKALSNYDPNRHTHTGLGGMPTTKIILEGAAGGKGDYRLGFKIVGSTYRPEAIMTHAKTGSNIQAQRRQ
jgi:insecticidal toxin complex protein TccC